MKEIWDNLVASLTEMLEIYRTILEVSREKRDILVKGKAEELEAINQKEEILILGAGKLENAREALVRQIAQQKGLTEEELSLTAIGSLAEPAMATKLEQIGKEFGKVIEELTYQNKLNAELIRQSLVYVNYNINVLAQSTSDQTYAPQGQGQQQVASARAFFDRKV